MIKEFKYSLYSRAESERDPWIIKNLSDDDAFAQQVAKEKLKRINARGLAVASLDSLQYQMQKAWNGFADVLTFSPDRVRERNVERIFDQLHDSEYLLIYGRSTEAKERLNLFSTLVTEAGSDERLKDVLLERLRSSYADISFVMPDDPLFEVKSAISLALDGLLGTSEEDLIERFGLIRDYMNYAFRLAESNTLLARITLEKYSARLNDFAEKEKGNLVQIKNLIAEENQVMDFLLLQYSGFYQDLYFAIKSTLENKWLSLLPAGDAKDEEKQTIISRKIDFLKNIQEFFLDEKIALSDATKVVSRLINEIQDLQTEGQSGISQIIELRLKDYGQFLGFLKAVSSGSLQGVTMKEKYVSYLSSLSRPVELEQALQEFLGDEEGFSPAAPVITKDEVLRQVKEDFAKAGIQDLVFGSFSGIDQTIIPIEKASLENVIFSGKYDWVRKNLSNVTSNGKVISEEVISLSGLAEILVPSPAVETQETVQPVVKPAETVQTQQTQATTDAAKSEKVAKILLTQKLKAKDIKATESEIVVKSVSDKRYELVRVSLISRPEIKFSFTYDDKEGMAYDVILHSSSGDKPVEAQVSLNNLVEKVIDASEVTLP